VLETQIHYVRMCVSCQIDRTLVENHAATQPIKDERLEAQNFSDCRNHNSNLSLEPGNMEGNGS